MGDGEIEDKRSTVEQDFDTSTLTQGNIVGDGTVEDKRSTTKSSPGKRRLKY